MSTKKEKKTYIMSFGEEVGNSVSHGVMSVLTMCALPLAAVRGYIAEGVVGAVCASVFALSLLVMFLGSTLYHAMAHETRHKEVFHILDHIFIYVAIAGTYTPIAISVIGGWQGWLIVALQWAMVIFGVFYKSLSRKSIPAVSLTIYLIMGWTVVFFLPLLAAACHTAGAFPMTKLILTLFGLSNTGLFGLCSLVTILIFAVVYYLIYRLTAREYYRIVRR